METVETILDPLILAAAGLAVILLIAALVGIRKVISGHKQIIEQQKNQNNLLLTISNVLTSNSRSESTQSRQDNVVVEKPKTQDAE